MLKKFETDAVCSKSVKTKVVFYKTEMNNEWSCFPKVSTEALFTKAEMNETLIFFNIA